VPKKVLLATDGSKDAALAARAAVDTLGAITAAGLVLLVVCGPRDAR
jgi:hypothetical protein